jgi:hypothetical protein
MVAGGVLVAALVVWALTRTVEPAATPIADTATSAPVTTPVPATGTSPAPAPGQIPPPVPAENPAAVPRMAAEDLRAKHNRGEVTLIDVRDARAYAQSHIPGSVNIPFSSIEAQLAQISRDQPIVTYCT